MALLGLTVGLGLLTRSSIFSEESLVHQYAGDILWALALFWTLSILRPQASATHIALGALIIAFTIEISQLYHAGWIDQLRSYRLGGLLLGFEFRWSDLACYTVGVWIGATIDYSILRKIKFPDCSAPPRQRIP